MVENPETHEREITEAAFKPGNLVWGTTIGQWNFRSLFQRGIVPPAALGERTLSTDIVCTAILSNAVLPRRYTWAKHVGPKDDNRQYLSPDDVAIIISRDALIARFPDQVFAVGELFMTYQQKYSTAEEIRRLFSIDESWSTVFGIPIRGDQWPRFDDEVRLLPREPKSFAITPDLWVGIVVREQDFPYLQYQDYDFETVLPIPVFSTECKLLAENLDLTRKAARRKIKAWKAKLKVQSMDHART